MNTESLEKYAITDRTRMIAGAQQRINMCKEAVFGYQNVARQMRSNIVRRIVNGRKLKQLDAKIAKGWDEIADLRYDISQLCASVATSILSLAPAESKLYNCFADVIKSALSFDDSYISILPDDDKADDEYAAMLDVSSDDDSGRRRWFDDFFGVFCSLSLEQGWRLTAFTDKNHWGGFAKFFLTDDKDRFCTNVFEHITISGDPVLGAIEAAMLDFAMTQINLIWHARYRRGYVIGGVRSLVHRFGFEEAHKILCQVIEKHPLNGIAEMNLSPRVDKIDDAMYGVRYVIFEPSSGFVENELEVNSIGQIGNLNKRRTLLFEYDNGIRY